MLLGSILVHSQAEAPSDSTSGLREISHNAFKEGEFLAYRIHYGFINAGRAELKVKKLTNREGRPVYHMVGTGRSVGMAEVFFKTRDRYETWIDSDAMVPWEFIRDVNEGGYIIKRHLHFDQFEQTVYDDLDKKDTIFSTPENVQDILSAFYYARTLDANELKKGDMIPIDMFLDHDIFHFRLKYLGKEVMKTKFGKIRCLKLMPIVQSGRVFKEKEGMTLWVSDDPNKIPIRLQADLAVGSVKIDLSDYKNTVSPLKFR
jgi:hypothetical protein